MKKLFVVAALFALTVSLGIAQTETKTKTLFSSSGETRHSGFGEFAPKVTSFDGKTSLLLGGGGAWLVNNQFYLGGAGFGLVPGNEKTFLMKNRNGIDTTVDGRVYMGYGGLMIGYIYNAEEIFHLSGQVLFGVGGLTAQDNDDLFNNSNNNDNDNDADNNSRNPWAAFYVIEPEIKAECNITNFFKLGLSVGYRFVEKFDNSEMFDKNQNLKDMKLSGFTAGLSFMFGSF